MAVVAHAAETLTILRRACIEWEWLDRVPKIGMMRDGDGRLRSPTRDEFAKLLAELAEHLAGMAQFSVATGLRQANVTRLQSVWSSGICGWVPISTRTGAPMQCP